MSAMSNLRSTMMSEISSLVAISCFRSAIRSERSGVVGGSTSVSILLKVGVFVSLVEGSMTLGTWGQIEAISCLICSMVLFNRVWSSCISFLSDCMSIAYAVVIVGWDDVELLEQGGELLVMGVEAAAEDWDSGSES